MKISLVLSALFLFFFGLHSAFAFDVNVDIKGPQDLAMLKDGISKTITARCLAKNVGTGSDSPLNVSIIQLGDTISFDAVLDTNPPKAFHLDLKGTGELSSAIDQMIAEIFTAPPMKSAGEEEPAVRIPPQAVHPEITLPFVATSCAVVNDTIYISSEDSMYKMVSGKAKPYWKPPVASRIYRLYPYQGAVLAITDKANSFHTYMVQDGTVTKSWNRCVVPVEGGLVASRVFTDLDFSDGINRWSKPETIEGNPVQIPEGQDILSMLLSDVSPSANGGEIVTFDNSSHLTILNGKQSLWASDTRFSTLPLYLTTRERDRMNKKDPQIRFYLKPRILLKGKDIITVQNEEGMSKLLGNVKMYDSSRILAYTPDESEFTERELATIRNYYCADIALDKGDILALVVKKSTSFIQRIDL